MALPRVPILGHLPHLDIHSHNDDPEPRIGDFNHTQGVTAITAGAPSAGDTGRPNAHCNAGHSPCSGPAGSGCPRSRSPLRSAWNAERPTSGWSRSRTGAGRERLPADATARSLPDGATRIGSSAHPATAAAVRNVAISAGCPCRTEAPCKAVQAIPMKALANAAAAPSRKQESESDGAAAAKAPDDAGKEKALEPLGSKAFPVLPELVGATGFEPATPRPPV